MFLSNILMTIPWKLYCLVQTVSAIDMSFTVIKAQKQPFMTC